MGGGLLQKVNRDTMQFATKLCHIVYADGSARDIAKMPKSDAAKTVRRVFFDHVGVVKKCPLANHQGSQIRRRHDRAPKIWTNHPLGVPVLGRNCPP